MSNELTITLNIDRTKAKQALDQFHSQEKAKIAELVEHSKQSEQHKAEQTRQSMRQRTAATMVALDSERKSVVDVGKAHEELGLKGKASFGQIVAGTTAAMSGMNLLIAGARALADSMDKAAAKSKEYTRNFAGQQERLGELAAMEGQRPDQNYVLEQARFNAKVGLTADQGIDFRTNFLNAGAQFIGKNISKDEASQLQLQSAMYARSKGLSPGLMGDLTGTVLGMRDFSKFGDRASEEALHSTDTMSQIVQRGKGETSELLKQISILGSKSFSEDETRGAFTSEADLATMISTMAETGQTGSAAEHSMMALRGLRGFGKKQGKLLKAAGINAQTSPIDAIKKLAPVVKDMAEKQHVKPLDILMQNFEQSEAAEQIEVLISKGHYGGIFEDRAKVASEGGDANSVLAGIRTAYTSDDRIKRSQADAQNQLREQEYGAKYSKVDIMRKKALAEMTANNEMTSKDAYMKDFQLGAGSFGMIGDTEQIRIDTRVREMIEKMAPGSTDALTHTKEYLGGLLDPQSRADSLNKQIGRATDMGVDPTVNAETLKVLMDIRDRLPAASSAPAALPSSSGPKTIGR